MISIVTCPYNDGGMTTLSYLSCRKTIAQMLVDWMEMTYFESVDVLTPKEHVFWGKREQIYQSILYSTQKLHFRYWSWES